MYTLGDGVEVRLALDCDKCELNAATARLKAEVAALRLAEMRAADEWSAAACQRDEAHAQIAWLERELHDTREALREECEGGRLMTDVLIRAESWAALWKRAATINRHDREWGSWRALREWCAYLSATPRLRSLFRALRIP